jgi:pimeloyl-ACP methyl ester carboxylesterase
MHFGNAPGRISGIQSLFTNGFSAGSDEWLYVDNARLYPFGPAFSRAGDYDIIAFQWRNYASETGRHFIGPGCRFRIRYTPAAPEIELSSSSVWVLRTN